MKDSEKQFNYLKATDNLKNVEGYEKSLKKSNLPDMWEVHSWNITNMDKPVFDFIRDKYAINSMIDIGCGPGDMVEYAMEKGLDAMGIDGDNSRDIYENPKLFFHDYTTGVFSMDKVYDLGWCIEVLEHIDEEYLDNIFDTFSYCKMICCTHALPGQIGNNHVNCQAPPYWLDIFKRYGFEHQSKDSFHIKLISDMEHGYMKRTGMLFVNRKYIL